MTVLQSLVKFYKRLEKRSEYIPQRGYLPVRIGFVLEIDRDGTPRSLLDRRHTFQRKRVAPSIMMPAVLRTSGIRSAFLWDKTSYAFGVTAIDSGVEGKKNVTAGQGRRSLEEHEAFRKQHLEALAQSDDEGLTALRKFVERWSPEQWSALGFTNEALDQNIAFRLSGEERRIDERDAARELVRSRTVLNSETSQCLVTGRLAPYAVLQPQFKGVAGALSSGAPLVSFNVDAFESYGKRGGANAPVSEEAGFRYGAALNWLLDRSNERSFRFGEMTVVYWASETEFGEASASAAEAAFAAGFGSSSDRNAETENAVTVGTGLQSPDHQRTPHDIAALKPQTRLHVLGLSPNSGRIVVRFWLVNTYGNIARNLERHRIDIAIDPPDRYAHRTADALLYETAVQRKAKNIPPRLAGELARAILTGEAYPRTLFASVLSRIRADKAINAARASICKAIINRDNDRDVVPVAFAAQSDDHAYNLGRLFAAYEYAERQVADSNATIRHKYVGVASATPRHVFPILMRGYERNASVLAKGEGNQRAFRVKAAKAVTQVLERVGGYAQFPLALTHEEQGRFFVGYYHQNAAFYTNSDRGAELKELDGASI